MAHAVVCSLAGASRAMLAALALAAASLIAPAHAGEAPSPVSAADVAAGERLYRNGLRADGTPLTALILHGLPVQGREAACVACHRGSGMGGAEGSTAVPPIIGAMLREPGRAAVARTARLPPGLQRARSATETRPAYTPDSLARALTVGIGAADSTLDPLMPRYQLDAAEVRQLTAYLDTLDVGTAPGLEGQTLHLATLVTADTPPDVRHASTDVLEACLAERSPPQAPDAQAATQAPPTWRLHRWTLGADPARWPDELAALQRDQPVFALISGSSGPDGRGAWQPIHRHCEQAGLPCVLPHTASVDDTAPGHWSFYFSRGVSLEASALAEHLLDPPAPGGWRQVHQIVQPDNEAARTGAQALQRRLAAGDVAAMQHSPQAADAASLLASLDARDALVLWLDAATLRAYTRRQRAPRAAGLVLVSGELTGLEPGVVAPTWREAAQFTHPYEPVERHLPRLALNAGRWLASRGLARADSTALVRLQAHSYSACEVTASALRRMGRRASREYFLELIEGAEDAAVATAYPRFTLGPGQRHGSQGIGLARFAAPGRERLQPVGMWMTPP